MEKILIITNSADPHSDSVINQIKKKESIFRVNTDELLNNFRYDFFIDDKSLTNSFINPIGRILKLEEIRSVYYRRPEKPILSEKTSFDYISISEAWNGFFHVLYSIYDKVWLGHPHIDKFASSRLVQLKTAQKIGWNIPPTIISRNPDEIRMFCRKYSELAIKPLGEKGASIDGQWFPYFTSRISAEQIINKNNSELSVTYSYLQAYIPKKNEWRITVIGNEVFPCILNSQDSTDGKIDWRTVHFDTIKHEIGEISETFKRQLIQYLNYLKLPFGAFDFILTPNNKFVFLECNPNGQWLWIEELTKLPISNSIAKWLETAHYDFIT